MMIADFKNPLKTGGGGQKETNNTPFELRTVQNIYSVKEDDRTYVLGHIIWYYCISPEGRSVAYPVGLNCFYLSFNFGLGKL